MYRSRACLLFILTFFFVVRDFGRFINKKMRYHHLLLSARSICQYTFSFKNYSTTANIKKTRASTAVNALIIATRRSSSSSSFELWQKA